MNLFGEIGHLITKIVRRTGTPTSSPALLENLFNSGRSLVSCPQCEAIKIIVCNPVAGSNYYFYNTDFIDLCRFLSAFKKCRLI